MRRRSRPAALLIAPSTKPEAPSAEKYMSRAKS
jgi:hypothetical protein